MTELCEVVITAPDPDWLYSFARALVEEGLAASAHSFTPVRSIYRWEGQVHERAEGRVSLHTSCERVTEVVACARREHPYEVPGVSTRPITGGNPDYLAWIAKETDMTARAWSLGKRSGWSGNRHDHPKGRARAAASRSPDRRNLTSDHQK